MAGEDADEVRRAFREAVNMAPKVLSSWLDSQESRSVGWTGGQAKHDPGGRESVGHASGRRIVDLLHTNKGELTRDDLAHMKKVSAYVKRHLGQGPPEQDVEHSRWRYSLMNWGHDPLQR